MPLIQKLEISNFLNLSRGSGGAWCARWPHQEFDLSGHNTAMNIFNGGGKSAMAMLIMGMLTADRKAIREVREYAFAPQSNSHYTHFRIQVLVSTGNSGGVDLLTPVDGEPGGEPMVFGLYGNSGENGELNFYSYQGKLDDCPIAQTNEHNHTFISNNVFKSQLDASLKHFPSNRKESSDRAWLDHVGTIFDLASIQQQLKYQKLRGAEGGHGYFDVNNPPGSDYSASVFYERLAPELLVEGMGDLGEADEHGIEDIIHTKASRIIVQRRKSAQQEEALRKAGNTIKELDKLSAARANVIEARGGYDAHRDKLSLEFASLKYVLADRPIPGVPRIPDEALPLARSMVLQEGKWFLPDRVMAEFSGEPVSEVNRRAQERNGLSLEKVDRSQVIEFPCHLDIRIQKSGHAGQLYSKETALALMPVTGKFSGAWTKETAIDALTRAFDWVEAHADTNPAREIRKASKAALDLKEAQRKTLNAKFEEHSTRWDELVREFSQIGELQSAYRAMCDSGLFSEAELASPAETGRAVEAAYTGAQQAVDTHKSRMMRLESVHAMWEVFSVEHPEMTPAALADRLAGDIQQAKEAFEEAKKARDAARAARDPAQKLAVATRNDAQKAKDHLERFRKTAPATLRFTEVFGDVSPVGLIEQLTETARATRERIHAIKLNRSAFTSTLKALAEFRSAHGNIPPADWLVANKDAWEERNRRVSELEPSLLDAKRRRAELEKSAVAAGRVAREAAAVAGGKHRALHTAVEDMKLGHAERESTLTLFSALLHAPVYDTADEARGAAARLDAAQIEAPVFLFEELQSFCRGGEISFDSAFAHTWLVGIRTRQVECLLDPALVEREKRELDEQIKKLGEDLESVKRERTEYSPESAATGIAREARKAIEGGYEEKDSAFASELAKLEADLPGLEAKTTQEMIDVIKATGTHQREFAGINEAFLINQMDEREGKARSAAEDLGNLDERIAICEKEADTKQEAVGNSATAALPIENLRRIQVYIDHPEDNPAFMYSAGEVRSRLEREFMDAGARKHFRFDQAAAFVRQGSDYVKKIEEDIAHHRKERDDIQNTFLPKLNDEIVKLSEAQIEVGKQERNIDHLVRELTRMYRSYTEWGDDLVAMSEEAILLTPLGGQTIGLHDAQSARERVELLELMHGEMDYEEKTGTRRAMSDAKAAYETQKQRFDSAIDLTLVGRDMELSEHMKAELVRAKAAPEIIDELHRVAKMNYERNLAANNIARGHLDEEWKKLGEWLNNFTKRLKTNFTLLASVFAPEIEKETKKVLKSGYQIIGKVADDADIRLVLDGVVSDIEKVENEVAAKSLTPYELSKQKTTLRQRIRDKFYREVIKDVRIKLVMPSISNHPLPLERKMVSTGQGIAMALLWIVRMAEFTTKRWQSEQGSSSAQRKRMHHTQFTIIDGAFSSLSDNALIKDALDSIGGTKGNFQLIITGHDQNYRNNFDYFPTLIVGKKLGNRFLYAEKVTRDQISPAALGLPEGAVGVMSLKVIPNSAGAASVA